MAEQWEEASAGLAHTRVMYDAPVDVGDPPEPPEQSVAPLPTPPEPSELPAAGQLPDTTAAAIDSAEPVAELPEDAPAEHVLDDTPPPPTDHPQEAVPSLADVPQDADTPLPQDTDIPQADPLAEIDEPDEPDEEPDWPADGAEMSQADGIPLPAEPPEIDTPDLIGEYPDPFTTTEWQITPWEPPEHRDGIPWTDSIDDELAKMAFAPIPTAAMPPMTRPHDSANADMLAAIDATRIL